ncbi:DUF4258 domain-containing protein [Acinetobacter qingfengensis]|uniref:Uncharacterized protein n=1 Tax=Acinetobacter qingfengensis TaxID=1262585 RepID=A0A1E7QYT9_9GAMM|nr:DUF4258 domain-containing protein [Acinetobacter qingfengensis]KAA8731010.1 DUF4258 domain-containing protein [Acinetobacter qingfengensis]OEY92211.1 hypothetical protein BJI46_05520 [Acinetobacter qingfengensis]
MCLSLIEATRKLREFAQDTSKIKLTSHARERMKERCISLKQIVCCFEHGDITEGPYMNTRGNCQLNVSVRTAGEYITATVAIKISENGESSIVVTTFKE